MTRIFDDKKSRNHHKKEFSFKHNSPHQHFKDEHTQKGGKLECGRERYLLILKRILLFILDSKYDKLFTSFLFKFDVTQPELEPLENFGIWKGIRNLVIN